MIFLRQLPVALLLLIFIACNEQGKEQSQSAANITVSEIPETEKSGETTFGLDSIALPAPGNEKKQPGRQAAAAPQPNPDWDKKIIKNASLIIEVAEYKKFNELVHTAARQWGGYIAQEEQNESGYKIENTITIKVPVGQFDDVVTALTPAKEKILVKKITSQDVTGEVVDTRSRMEAKRQVRLRYMDLLKQAKNMEEILQVQNVINDIQVQIESAAGRVNYLTHASAYSTIQLTFYQVLDEQAEKTNDPDFGQKVLNALQNGLNWIGELVVVLLTLWPLWLAGAFAWWGFRKWRTGKVTGNK